MFQFDTQITDPKISSLKHKTQDQGNNLKLMQDYITEFQDKITKA